jgi:hypothetical protein
MDQYAWLLLVPVAWIVIALPFAVVAGRVIARLRKS